MYARMFGLVVGLLGVIPLGQSAHARSYIIVAVDASGSMAQTMVDSSGKSVVKMEAAKRALKTVLTQVPTKTHVGVLAFARGEVWCIYQPAPVNRRKLLTAIDGVIPDGLTPLGQAMRESVTMIQKLKAKDRKGKFQLVIVSDGNNTVGVAPLTVVPDLRKAGARMDVIGVDMGARHELARKARTYHAAADAKQLFKAFKKVVLVEKITTDASGMSDYDLIASIPTKVARALLKSVVKSATTAAGKP